jgi:erythromycin esterase-like protein
MRNARFPRLRYLPAVLLLLLTLPRGAWAQGFDGPRARPPKPVGHPLLPGIWRLDGDDPALPTGDLEPLRGIVGKATTVGLGESVHTSGGFHEMKDRTIRYLVQKLGFRAVAIESPWIDADQVAAYVQTCEGTPEDALKGLFGVWQSAEIRDLVQWMCEWNRSHRKPQDKLSFFGFDIQQPQNDRPALTAFLARTGVSADSPWITALAACANLGASVSDASYGQCTEGLQQIDAYFQQNAATIVRQTSQRDFEIARLNLTGLRAWEDESYYSRRDNVKSTDARDQGMAYAFGVLRGQRAPKAKTVVWAHNFHLSKATTGGAQPMGSYLAQSLGRSYVNLALVAHEMYIDWLGVGCGLADPPFPDSVEDLLHALGEPTLLVDLAFPGTHDPYIPPGPRGLGYYIVDPPELYNGVLYLDVSPKMTPLAWASCQ